MLIPVKILFNQTNLLAVKRLLLYIKPLFLMLFVEIHVFMARFLI